MPLEINTPGRYCVTQDLKMASAGIAITVTADHVTIDFAGHRLEGAGSGVGIYLIGVGSRRHVVEDMRVAGNTYSGIQVVGEQSVVERCFVVETGGASSDPRHAFGIQNDQADSFIFDNRVMKVSGGDRNNGIFCNGGGVVPLLRGNSVVGASTPYGGGCTLVGATNYP